MKYKKLGKTDIDVSLICLGTMTWGEQNTSEEAFEQMDYAFEKGINFFDTAEMYPVPPNADTCHRTETIIGQWFESRQVRDQIICATKVVGRAEFSSHIRDGQACLNRKNIMEAVDGSLRRLKTDYIDLYQVHWPDRPTNFFGQLEYKYPPDKEATPLEETLEALTELVQSGKVRTIGLSNETAWGVSTYLRLSEEKNLERIVSIQNPYNLLNRSFEIGLAEFSHRDDVGLLAYSPLAFGVLSGKYLNGQKPDGARLTKWKRFGRYQGEIPDKATEAYVSLAKEAGIDPSQMALAFVNRQPFVTSNIIGATTMDQLKSNIASIDIKLEKSLLKEIEKIHRRSPNPCP